MIQGAVSDGDFAGGRIYRETAAGIVDKAIGIGLACIRIGSGYYAYDCAVRGVLSNSISAEGKIGRRLIDVG